MKIYEAVGGAKLFLDPYMGPSVIPVNRYKILDVVIANWTWKNPNHFNFTIAYLEVAKYLHKGVAIII